MCAFDVGLHVEMLELEFELGLENATTPGQGQDPTQREANTKELAEDQWCFLLSNSLASNSALACLSPAPAKCQPAICQANLVPTSHDSPTDLCSVEAFQDLDDFLNELLLVDVACPVLVQEANDIVEILRRHVCF